MKTSDKELDELFNSKLNNLEAAPSAALWENISAELDQKQKKKSFVPVLRIAAGIIVILSVGLLLLRKDMPVKNQLPKKLAKVELEKKNPAIDQIKNLGDKNSMLLLTAKNEVVKEASAVKNSRSKAVFAKPLIQPKSEPENVSTQIMAQSKPETNQQEIPNNQFAEARIAVVPDASISLKPQPETEIVTQPTLKAQVLAAANTTAKVKHKRIRSIGDVVNLVMAKVDKREDKLIQFTDSDDGDESNVTGINLGIINFKKEK